MTVLLALVVLLALANVALVCWLSTDCHRHGHAWTITWDDDRIFLRCLICFQESCGWQLVTRW